MTKKRTKTSQTQVEVPNNPLAKAYHALEEPEKIKIRKSIMERSEISLPAFYYTIRTGRTTKLIREVFAEALSVPVEKLFPYAY